MTTTLEGLVYSTNKYDPRFKLQSSAASTALSNTIQSSVLTLKVSVPANTLLVKASFDPKAAEETQATRELNRALELGYQPPRVSTREWRLA